MPRPDAANRRHARPVVVLGEPPTRVGVEVASTPIARAEGLMFRQHLAPDRGMLFVFDEPGVHTFWMRNTLVPLDIVFMDRAGCVVGLVERAQPLSDRPLGVDAVSELALEVVGGFAARHRVHAGSVARLPCLPSKEPS